MYIGIFIYVYKYISSGCSLSQCSAAVVRQQGNEERADACSGPSSAVVSCCCVLHQIAMCCKVLQCFAATAR